MSVRVPQYLHLPVQVLFWDSHELALLIMAFTFSLILESLIFWAIFFGIAFVVIRIKRNRPRGWLLHIPYRLGLMRVKGYPLPTAKRFSE